MVNYVDTLLLEIEAHEKLFSLVITMKEHLKEQIDKKLVP